MPRFRPFAALTNPHTYNLFIQAVGILLGLAMVWVVIATLLWAGGIIACLLLVIGLAVTVFQLDRTHKRREMWVLAGHCGRCGYDLRSLSSSVCPECGHDAAADEPTWRKRQREHQQRLNEPAAGLPLPSRTPAQPPAAHGFPPQSAELTPAPRLR